MNSRTAIPAGKILNKKRKQPSCIRRKDALQPAVSSYDKILGLQRMAGNQEVTRFINSGWIQFQPAPAGPSLLPPGDCTYAEHRILQDLVDLSCNKERRCTQNDDCATIWQRIQDNADCIKARTTINAKCFRGGDPGHMIAVAYAVGALGNCWAVYNRKCQPKTPPVPVPVPVPEEKPKPVIDKGFMERMAEITGLTGAALVIYIIISEGSRLFPPRNLVPVP